MKRGGYLKRTKRVNPVNRKRKALRFRIAFLSAERVQFVKAQACAVVGFRLPPVVGFPVQRPVCMGQIECAHVRNRGNGGTWREIVPLCHRHHTEQHAVGVQTFHRLYGLDLAAIAAELAMRGPQE